MVDLRYRGKLKEELLILSSKELSELCYILDLRRSGSIDTKIDTILSSEYSFHYVRNRLNFLLFGLTLINNDFFSSKELSGIIIEYDLPRQRRILDKMVEIIKSEKITPRALIGHLTKDEIVELYFIIFNKDTDLNSEGIIRKIINHFNLNWLEEIMDMGFILMPMGKNPDLIKTKLIIKETAKKFNIKALRVDDFQSSELITKEIIEKIKESDYLFVDLSNERPNVYYELGYAHGIGKKAEKIILISEENTPLHFDIRNMRIIKYKSHSHLRKELKKRLNVVTKR